MTQPKAPRSATAGLTLDDLPAIMDLDDAAARVLMEKTTLRRAIKAGELQAFVPRGKTPGRTGRGQGYRITAAALQAWYFGDPSLLDPKKAPSDG